jgi:ribosomal protein S18 acetylase RimI-like enzyme
MKKQKIYGLTAENISDFSFLVEPESVADILSEGDTTGFAVRSKKRYVGALCGRFVTPTEYMISSIYVLEDERRAGIGRAMLEALYELLGEDATIVSINVKKGKKTDVPLRRFLEACGFEEYYKETGRTYMTDVSEIEKLKLSKAGGMDIRPFLSLPDYVFKAFLSDRPEDVYLPAGEFSGEHVDRDVSVGLIKNKRLCGFALIERMSEDELIFDSIYVDEGESQRTMMALIACAREGLRKKYDVGTKLYIPTADDRLSEFVESIFPEGALEEGVVTYKKSMIRDDTREEDYSSLSLSEFLDQEQEVIRDDMFIQDL